MASLTLGKWSSACGANTFSCALCASANLNRFGILDAQRLVGFISYTPSQS